MIVQHHTNNQMSDLMLTIHTQRHTYAVLHHQEIALRTVVSEHALETTDHRNRPLQSADLALLLDPADHSTRTRRCAFVVPLRRRSVALLCDTVGELLPVNVKTIVPLPLLLGRRLPHSWIAGVYLHDDLPILLLDLRQIALHVLRQPTLSQGEPA